VGKKTAQRMILDLKDKLDGVAMSSVTGTAAGSDATADARDALLSMGFSSAEIAAALKGFEGATADTQSLLRHALKRLGGGA